MFDFVGVFDLQPTRGDSKRWCPNGVKGGCHACAASHPESNTEPSSGGCFNQKRLRAAFQMVLPGPGRQMQLEMKTDGNHETIVGMFMPYHATEFVYATFHMNDCDNISIYLLLFPIDIWLF